MLFDSETVIDAMKAQMATAEKRRDKDISTAIISVLDDMAVRMRSVAMVKNYTVSLAVSDRTKTLTGNNNDLRYIYYLKIGSGEEQEPLRYRPPERFIEKFDNPSAAAGTPTYYTIFESDDGSPTIKFDVPLQATDSLLVYYFAQTSQQNISRFRSMSAVTAGALAYFWGIASEKGAVQYGLYKELMGLTKESDKFNQRHDTKFVMNRFNEEVRAIAIQKNETRS